MIRSKEHSIDIMAKRKANGKKGTPHAVRRWAKRTNQPIPEITENLI